MPFTLFPAVDIRSGSAVRLTQGRADEATVYDEDPVAAAQRFVDGGAEWLHVVDLDAAFEGTPKNRHLITDIIEGTGAKVQASGGIRTTYDLDAAIDHGAARVVIGTMALENPDFIQWAVSKHGEKIAVGLDAEGTTLKARGWTEHHGDLFEAVSRFTAMGVSRFVFTDISRDGMLEGPNLERLAQVADTTTAKVTASGGVATLEDLRLLAACHRNVDAVIVGKALYAGRFDVPEALDAIEAVVGAEAPDTAE